MRAPGEADAEVLHRSHPKATDVGLAAELQPGVARRVPRDPARQSRAWLSGVVYGPQVRISLAELRKAVPARYPIRNYPDITHSRQCQYPGARLGRRLLADRGPRGRSTPGPGTRRRSSAYCSPDRSASSPIPKAATTTSTRSSGAAWAGIPNADVVEILRQYSRSFIGDDDRRRLRPGTARAGDELAGAAARTNDSVERTLPQFEELERQRKPGGPVNWRFQQALYRAYYDAYVRTQADRRDSASKARRRGTRHRPRKRGSLAAIRQRRAILGPAPRSTSISSN